MGRMARRDILSDGCFAHVFSVAIESRWIFKDQQDFKKFHGLLIRAKHDYRFKVHYYCLMNTHFHLAVALEQLDSFSKGLQRVKWDYTQSYNKRHKRRGPLWRERYRSLLIENERYLAACGFYIEHNPVKARMVSDANEWAYSSARNYSGKAEDTLVDVLEGDREVTDLGISEGDFEKGVGIGSDWFKYCLRKGLSCVSPKK